MDTRKDSEVKEHKDEKDGKEEKKSLRKRRNAVLDIGSGSGSGSGTVSVWADRLRNNNKRPRYTVPEVVKRVSSSRLFIDFSAMASTLLVEIASFLEIRNRINFAKTQRGNYLLLKEPVGRIVTYALGRGVVSRLDSSLGNAQQQLTIPISDFIWIDQLKYGSDLTPYVFRPVSDMSLRQYTKRRLQTYYNEILASTTSDIRGKVSRSRLRKIGSHVINHLTQLNQAACYHSDMEQVCLDSSVLFQELSTCPELEPYRIESKRVDVLSKQNTNELITKFNQYMNSFHEWKSAEKARVEAEKKYHDTPINERKERTTPFLGLEVRPYPDHSDMAISVIGKRAKQLARERERAIFTVMTKWPSLDTGVWDIDTNGPLKSPLSEAQELQLDKEKQQLESKRQEEKKKRNAEKRREMEKLELQQAMRNNLLNLDPSKTQQNSEENGNDDDGDYDDDDDDKESKKVTLAKSDQGALCWPLAFAFLCWERSSNWGNLKVLTLSLVSESEAQRSVDMFKEYVYGVRSVDLDHGLNARRKKLLTELHNKYDAIFDLLRMSEFLALKTFNLQTNRIWFPNHVKALTTFIKNSVRLTSLGLDYQDVCMPCNPIHYDPNSEHPTTWGANVNRSRERDSNDESIEDFHDAIVKHDTLRWERLCVPRPVRWLSQVEGSSSTRKQQEQDFVIAVFEVHGHVLEEFSYKWMSLPVHRSDFIFRQEGKESFANGLADPKFAWPKLTSLHTDNIEDWDDCKSALQFLAPSLRHLHLDQAIALFDIVSIVLSPKVPLQSLQIDSLHRLFAHAKPGVKAISISIATQLPHLQKLLIKFESRPIETQSKRKESENYIIHTENLILTEVVCQTKPKLTHFMMCSTSGPLKSFEDASYIMTNNKYLRRLGLSIGSTLQTLVLPYGYRLESDFVIKYSNTSDNTPLFPNLQVLDFGTYANQKMYPGHFHQVQSPGHLFQFIEKCLGARDGRRIEIRMITVPSPDPTEDKIILYDRNYIENETINTYDFEILCIAILSATLRYQVDENYDEKNGVTEETIIPLYPNVNVAVVDSKSADNMFFDPADLLDYEQFRARIGDERDHKELKDEKIPTRDEMMQELAKQGFNEAEWNSLKTKQFEMIRKIASNLHNDRLKRLERLENQGFFDFT